MHDPIFHMYICAKADVNSKCRLDHVATRDGCETQVSTKVESLEPMIMTEGYDGNLALTLIERCNSSMRMSYLERISNHPPLADGANSRCSFLLMGRHTDAGLSSS